ncbi:DNA-formamidopyrimidine glycosylase family protein [Nocardioides terrisoli]|uniref:DNA-formamidopyrimidine glycosylase family protein n=1 Tax=Nocardioides terrisoli TaxID=3388267 RepID=UPI00287B998F|nr:DNA-formamidopyrimidine glycosylase family protein [Nocardioides marmorisolisilvae]
MPEGDTVWQAAKRLRRLDDQILVHTDFRLPSLATTDLAGSRVLTTRSRGKHLLTRLDSGLSLHSHLKMEGSWAVHDRGARWRKPAHTARVVLQTESLEAVGSQIVLDLLPSDREDEYVGRLGPDLLGDDWDPDEAVRRLAAQPAVPLADALLDQRNLAGIGNVYKCELCFLTGVDPHRPVGEVSDLQRLVSLARRVLLANRDRVDRVTTGRTRRGERTWVYGRRGPCLRCGTPIEYDELGPPGAERGTWWCPRCQR